MNEKQLKLIIRLGFRSRKFIMTLISLVLLTGMTVLTLKYPLIEKVFPTFMSGILGVLGLYLTGNEAQKALVKEPVKPPEEDEEGEA